jgi:hypothetical protein
MASHHKTLNVKMDELVLKAFDGSAACVKPSTKELLLVRGWAILS